MAFLLRSRRRKPPSITYVLPRSQPQPSTSPHPQTQSPIFGSLPCELRLEIFRLVLDCSPIPIDGLRAPPALKLQAPSHLGAHVITVSQARLLSLLLTCWRSYIEALPVLYGVNTFSLNTMNPMRLLAAGIGPGPWLIRRLEIQWYLGTAPNIVPEAPAKGWVARSLSCGHTQSRPDRWQKWVAIWDTMRGLEGLQWLYVELNALSSFWHGWQEHETTCLMALRGPWKDGIERRLKLNWHKTVAEGKAAEDVLEGWVIERSPRRY